MKITFDPKKSDKNVRDRNLSFDRAADFDWGTAVIFEDNRFVYPEQRLVATGFLGERLHVLCFTPIGDDIRVISFRKANSREIMQYEEKIKSFQSYSIYQEKAANEQRW